MGRSAKKREKMRRERKVKRKKSELRARREDLLKKRAEMDVIVFQDGGIF